MKMTIRFTHDKMAFYYPLPTDCIYEKDFYADLFPPEVIRVQGNMICEPNPDNLYVLNKCLSLMSVSEKYENRVISLNVASINTFVSEAVKHKEYCAYEVLNEVGYYLSASLKGWADETKYDARKILDGYETSITPNEIKQITAGVKSPNIDTFHCEHSLEPCFYIQVAYSILSHYFKHKKIIKKCANCEQLFIPKRTNEEYCNRITLVKTSRGEIKKKTCKEINRDKIVKRSQSKEPERTRKNIRTSLLRRGEKTTLREYDEAYEKCNSDEERLKCNDTWREKTYKRKPKKTTI